MYITVADLLLVTYCLVDDWYQHTGVRLVGRTVGCKPVFSDSEMLTLMLAIDFFEFTCERRFVAFLRANYLRPGHNSSGCLQESLEAISYKLNLLAVCQGQNRPKSNQFWTSFALPTGFKA